MKTRQILFVGSAVALAGCAVVREPAYETLIAHRGESFDAPENTLPAYKTAVERGFGFECDIYLSKDGRMFTFHDGNLARTTNGACTNRCCDVSWADTVSKVNVGGWGKWKGSKFDGTRPALLEEVLELARDGRQIYVEVKAGPESVPYIRDVFAKQTKAHPGNALFICFNQEVCRMLKRSMPEYKVYWLVCARYGWGRNYPVVTAREIIWTLKDLGVDGVDILFDPAVHTAEFVKEVHDAGYEFHVWTIDDPEKAKKAFAVGVDSVTTNRAKFIRDTYEAEKAK